MFKIPGTHKHLRRSQDIRIQHVPRIAPTPDVGGGFREIANDRNHLGTGFRYHRVRVVKGPEKLGSMDQVGGLERNGLLRNAAPRRTTA